MCDCEYRMLPQEQAYDETDGENHPAFPVNEIVGSDEDDGSGPNHTNDDGFQPLEGVGHPGIVFEFVEEDADPQHDQKRGEDDGKGSGQGSQVASKR